MSRGITTEEATEYAAPQCRPAFLFEGVFGDETLRLSDTARNITFSGNTFLGNGWLTGYSPAAETEEVRAAGISVTLSGVPETLISLVLSSSTAACTGKLWIVVLNASWNVIGNGYLLFSGKLDSPEITDSRDGAQIEIGYESILASLLVRRERRYTDQEARMYDPTDGGLQYVVQAQQWNGAWGEGENPLRLRRRDRR